MILIVTMWIMLVLAGLVLVLARTMRVEAICSSNDLSTQQADAIEQGAIQYVLSHTESLEGKVPTEVDMPCEAVHVGQGAFWIIRPNYDDSKSFAFGLVDEASKVNLNTASQSVLAMLPYMNMDLAAGIIDWRDTDSTPTQGGAEDEYYLMLPDPYPTKNGPLDTIEELLLIKDMTPETLYGEDTNRNGVLDPNEDDANASDPPDDRDGILDRGMAACSTIYSVEANKDATGAARININNPPTSGLATLLTTNMSSKAAAILDLVRRGRPFRNILDFYVRAGLTPDEFKTIADKLTTAGATETKGLINVSTAPKEVLAALPGLEESDVTAILAKRAEAGLDLTNVAWVASALTPAKAVAIGSLITSRSYQFSADIVSVSGDGRAFKRCRIVVDARTSPTKLLYRQDLTHLGWPLDPEILTKLRSGASIDSITPTQTVVQEVAR